MRLSRRRTVEITSERREAGDQPAGARPEGECPLYVDVTLRMSDDKHLAGRAHLSQSLDVVGDVLGGDLGVTQASGG